MNAEPFREYVFCHYCNQWGMEDQFSVTTVVVGGVVRQLLYHTVSFFYGAEPVTHIANHRGEFDGVH